MTVKVESEKVGLKLNIQKIKITASGPITSWQIDGETVETMADFIFLGCKITADGDCSHEIKRLENFGSRQLDIGIPALHLKGFPCGSTGKESTCSAGDLGLIPGLGQMPWRRERLQYSGLEKSMDCVVHGFS